MLGTALLLYILFLVIRAVEASGCSCSSSFSLLSSIFLLVVFAGVIVFMVHSERIRSQKNAHLINEQADTVEHAAPHQPDSFWLSAGIIVISLICLCEGAELSVESAKTIGVHAGMDEMAIGATIVALGTSLPELLTCLIAAFKGHDDLSIGNLVGSNIFNTLLVIGAAGLARPFSVLDNPDMIGLSYWLMLGVLVLFSLIAFINRKISRVSGFILFAVYVGYILYNLFCMKTG
jgi:cation:H+ antiporter